MKQVQEPKKTKKDLKISQGKSFDLNKPYVPGKQSYEGVPNATPEMLRRLKQRREKNTGGQELPGFLKNA
jgi:hypothetical protein